MGIWADVLIMMIFSLIAVAGSTLLFTFLLRSPSILNRSYGRSTLSASGQACAEQPVFGSKYCPLCGRLMQASWWVCPFDGSDVG